MSKTVGEVMHKGVISVPGTATLPEIAQTMVQNHIHAVVVVNERGEATGLVSDIDMLAGEWLASDVESLELMRNLQADTLKTSPVATVDVKASVDEAVKKMVEAEVHRLVVCSKDRPDVPVGVISVSDIVREMAR